MYTYTSSQSSEIRQRNTLVCKHRLFFLTRNLYRRSSPANILFSYHSPPSLSMPCIYPSIYLFICLFYYLPIYFPNLHPLGAGRKTKQNKTKQIENQHTHTDTNTLTHSKLNQNWKKTVWVSEYYDKKKNTNWDTE